MPSLTIGTHVCAASVAISISLNTYSHPACGDVSHSAYMTWNESGTILIPIKVNDSVYEFTGLSTQTEYNMTVVIINNNNFRKFKKSVKTLVSKCTYMYTSYHML